MPYWMIQGYITGGVWVPAGSIWGRSPATQHDDRVSTCSTDPTECQCVKESSCQHRVSSRQAGSAGPNDEDIHIGRCRYLLSQILLRATTFALLILLILYGSFSNLQLEGVAKPRVMVTLRCFTDAELLWQYAKIWLLRHQGSVWVVFESYHYIAWPLKPHFGTRI